LKICLVPGTALNKKREKGKEEGKGKNKKKANNEKEK